MIQDKVFLQAAWRDLLMLNFEVDPRLLARFVPRGTELDDWSGKAYVSLVGFRFLETKICGFSIPFHRDFDEVNLRFYVRRTVADEVRRGVVFIREVVPRWAVATIAREVYNENYVTLPIEHKDEPCGATGRFVEYGWRTDSGWNRMRLLIEGEPYLPAAGSHEQFITEHYWGYAVQRRGETVEYRVEHPSWRVWNGVSPEFEGDTAELYGRELAMVLRSKPASAILAEGSEVTVFRGCRE